jgi:hypothetical protein
MEEIIKNVKTSSMLTETEHLIKEMIENIGIIRKNRGTNSSAVKDQKRIIENIRRQFLILLYRYRGMISGKLH